MGCRARGLGSLKSPMPVTADAAIVLDRLTARGRESAAAIARRARRTVTSAPEAGWIELRNSGPLNEAGDALIALLLDAAAAVAAP